MYPPETDRILRLGNLNSYPGSDVLDMTFYLPRTEDPTRKVWLMIPESSPEIEFDDILSIISDSGSRDLAQQRNLWKQNKKIARMRAGSPT